MTSIKAKENRFPIAEAYSQILLPIFAVAALFFVYFIVTTYNSINQIEETQKHGLVEKVSIAMSAIEPVLLDYRAGRIDQITALTQTRQLIGNLTYEDENGENYFFMGLYNGIMMVQPFNHTMEFTNQLDLLDENGNYPIREIIRVAQTQPQGGFISYYHEAPALDHSKEKLSYVIGIPELECFIGTGIYLYPIYNQRIALVAQAIIIGVAFALLLLIPSILSLRTLQDHNSDLESEIAQRIAAQNDLQKSEAWLKAIYDNAGVAIAMIDQNRKIANANERWLNLLGVEPPCLEGLTLQAVTHAGDFLESVEKIDQILAGEVLQHQFQQRLVRKDGSVIWVESFLTPLALNHGETNAVLSVHIDITQRRVTEQALYETERRLLTVIRNSPIILFMVDPQGKILFIEGRGLAADRSRNLPSVHPTIVSIEEKIHDRIPDVLAGQTIQWMVEQDGSYFDTTLQPLYDENQKITGIIGVATDISTRIEIENKLRISEENARALLNAPSDMAMLLTNEGEIIAFNDALAQAAGHSPEELAHINALDLVPKKLAEQRMLRFEQARIIGKPIHFEDTDGERHYFNQIHPILDEKGQVNRMAIFIQDHTRWKESEKEQIRLNRFLRTLSECNQALVHATDEATLLQDITQIIVQIGNYRTAWIARTRPDQQEMFIEALSGSDNLLVGINRLSLVQSSAGPNPFLTAWRYNQIISINQVTPALRANANLTPLIPSNAGSLCIFPLTHEEENYGLLVIFNQEENVFDDITVRHLAELSADLAFGIHTLEVRAQNRENRAKLLLSNAELAAAYDDTLAGWANALELRERETYGHSKRVVDLTLRLAILMNIPSSQHPSIRRGSLLHDIGKMAVPDSILLKPGPLTPEEWVVMRQHPTNAYQLLSPITFLGDAVDIPHYHHEWWNGKGYPEGLSGEEIPLAARIFAVIDVWDALTSDRPYRPAWPKAKILEYIQGLSGQQFDPAVVEAFMRLAQEL